MPTRGHRGCKVRGAFPSADAFLLLLQQRLLCSELTELCLYSRRKCNTQIVLFALTTSQGCSMLTSTLKRYRVVSQLGMLSSPKEAANNRSVRIIGPDATIRFVLKDGTGIHRIGPPTEVSSRSCLRLISSKAALSPKSRP